MRAPRARPFMLRMTQRSSINEYIATNLLRVHAMILPLGATSIRANKIPPVTPSFCGNIMYASLHKFVAGRGHSVSISL